jgi:hypothetical protein
MSIDCVYIDNKCRDSCYRLCVLGCGLLMMACVHPRIYVSNIYTSIPYLRMTPYHSTDHSRNASAQRHHTPSNPVTHHLSHPIKCFDLPPQPQHCLSNFLARIRNQRNRHETCFRAFARLFGYQLRCGWSNDRDGRYDVSGVFRFGGAISSGFKTRGYFACCSGVLPVVTSRCLMGALGG